MKQNEKDKWGTEVRALYPDLATHHWGNPLPLVSPNELRLSMELNRHLYSEEKYLLDTLSVCCPCQPKLRFEWWLKSFDGILAQPLLSDQRM